MRWKLGRRFKRPFSVGALLAIVLGPTSMPAYASLTDCQDLYVIRVYVNPASLVPQAVFAESADAVSGSYWIYPAGTYTAESYQMLYSALLAAKLSRTKMTITTNGPSNCSIGSASYLLTSYELRP